MTVEPLEDAIISVLAEVQAASGLDCPELTGLSKPLDELPCFDSKTWPVATTILATKIDIIIGDDINLFFDESTKTPRSIDEIAAFIRAMSRKKPQQAVAA
jgi:hypothetical protein